MRKLKLIQLGIIVLVVGYFINFFSFNSCTALAQETKPIRVIVIGWDGVQRNYLVEILKDKTIIPGERIVEPSPYKEILPNMDFLPNLKKIIDQGWISKIYITENTATKAGWAQILTGYSADVTGVYTNYVFKEIPDGYSIFGRLHDKFGKDKPIAQDNVYNLMVTGKDNHIGTLKTDRENRDRYLFS